MSATKKTENQAKEREQEAAQQRKRTRNQAFNQDLCIICQNNTNQQLHAVATLEWGQKFLKMAQEIDQAHEQTKMLNQVVELLVFFMTTSVYFSGQ